MSVMSTPAEMHILVQELESARDAHMAGTLTETAMWVLVDKASIMLDDPCFDPFEDHLKIIYTLLSAVWANIRSVDAMQHS